MRDAGTRSITGKLTYLVSLAIGCAMVVVAVLAVWQEATRYLETRRDTLLATATAFAAATGDALASGDQRAASLALRGIGSLPTIQFADLRNGAGSSVANIGSGVRLQGDLDLSERDKAATPLGLLTTRTVAVTVPVRKDGQRIGSLVLVGDTSDLWSRLTGVLAPVAFGSVVALAIGLTISLRLQRSITSPLIALTRVMASVQASHDYATDVAVDSDDEIGLLARSFQAMMLEVGERDRQLVAHRDRLERDVAERTHDLSLAKDEAEAANAAKSDFLATMSHEIRTPMNGMLVMAELLAGSDLPDRQRRYADVIARSGQSLVAIINDILDFSKIEAGKLTLERISFPLADIVDTVVTLFAEKARGKGLDIAAFVHPDLPEIIQGDPVRLTQVVSNLVNNALKFTETGSVRLDVEARDGRLHLSVSDTGIGIPSNKLGALFSAFTQADQTTTRRFGGTGLGLAISKRLIDAMDGSIVVDSAEGRGSTFTVLLPLPEMLPARHAQPKPRRPVAVALSGSATAETLTRSLVASGFDVLPAGSDAPADLLADASALLRLGRPQGAERVVAVAAMDDASGAEALRLGLADLLLRRPIVQAEWRAALAGLEQEGALLPAPASPPREAKIAVEAAIAGLHVLVVDDSEVNREVAREALARLGMTAELVDSSRAALAALADRRFDAVLMDGSMPDMDGYEATRLLRQREAEAGLARMPVIALTAHVVGPAASLWQTAGMDDVLHKPFTVAGLAEVIRRNLAPEALQRVAVAPRRIAPSRTSEPDPNTGPTALLDEETLSGLEAMAASAGDGFMRRVIALFSDGGPQSLRDIRNASAARDATAVASSSHKFKSMSMNVGAARLASRLATIEMAALDEGSIPSADAVSEAEQLLHHTLRALQDRLDPPRDRRAA